MPRVNLKHSTRATFMERLWKHQDTHTIWMKYLTGQEGTLDVSWSIVLLILKL